MRAKTNLKNTKIHLSYFSDELEKHAKYNTSDTNGYKNAKCVHEQQKQKKKTETIFETKKKTRTEKSYSDEGAL